MVGKHKKSSVKQLYDLARQASGSQRNHYIRLLIQNAKGKAYIRKLLQDEDGDLRAITIRLLGPADLNPYLQDLAELLRTENIKVKRLITAKLSSLKGERVMRILKDQLDRQYSDPVLHKLTITALGDSGHVAAVGPLIRTFEKARGNTDVKRTVLVALNKLRDKHSIPLLLNGLDDPDSSIRLWCVKALRPLVRELDYSLIKNFAEKESDPEVKCRALQLLAAFDREEVPGLLLDLILNRKAGICKYDILKVLKRYNRQQIMELLESRENRRGEDHTRSAREILRYLEREGRHVVPSSLRGTWTRYPLYETTQAHLFFFSDGTGLYEEISMGGDELSIPFGFELKEGLVSILSRRHERVDCVYSIIPEIFDHPYEGGRPCFVLRFLDKGLTLDGINITGTEYYRFTDEF